MLPGRAGQKGRAQSGNALRRPLWPRRSFEFERITFGHIIETNKNKNDAVEAGAICEHESWQCLHYRT